MSAAPSTAGPIAFHQRPVDRARREILARPPQGSELVVVGVVVILIIFMNITIRHVARSGQLGVTRMRTRQPDLARTRLRPVSGCRRRLAASETEFIRRSTQMTRRRAK